MSHEVRIARHRRAEPLDRDGPREAAGAHEAAEVDGGHPAGADLGVEGVPPEHAGVASGHGAAGAWTSYALGSANDDLPTYIALPDLRGEPPNGKANWSNGFLPAKHQAVVMAAQQPQ